MKFTLKIIICSFFAANIVFAKEKIIYKYKKYEKFDFETLSVDGQKGGPGDLSLIERNQKKYKYKLPYRRNFHYEMRKSVARVR